MVHDDLDVIVAWGAGQQRVEIDEAIEVLGPVTTTRQLDSDVTPARFPWVAGSCVAVSIRSRMTVPVAFGGSH